MKLLFKFKKIVSTSSLHTVIINEHEGGCKKHSAFMYIAMERTKITITGKKQSQYTSTSQYIIKNANYRYCNNGYITERTS